MADITRILSQIDAGDDSAARRLLPIVYEELREMAGAKMAREPGDHTLQSTALVHEAYLRLLGTNQPVSWANRRHFFAAAAEAMRRVLVDAARRRRRLKRGGDHRRVSLEMAYAPEVGMNGDVEALSEALELLARKEPRKSELVKLRFFAGMTMQQAADLLGISNSTAERDWAYARAWLFREMTRETDGARP